MPMILSALASMLVMASVFIYSCHSDGHEEVHHHQEDVSVDITGSLGVDFDARLEDDVRSRSLSGAVPFSALFADQVGFFQAVVDKASGGPEQICVRVTTLHDSQQTCSAQPHARVEVTVFF